jgi:glycosyltransferase involved in cell wall biosynthesis
VAPSIYESFGLIYLEAMNYAKPVIGCRSGGVPEVIDHGQTGLLVEPQDPAALAEAIVSLLQRPGRLHEMGIAARKRLLEEFTYVQMARRFAQAYRKAIRSFQNARRADHLNNLGDVGRIGDPPHIPPRLFEMIHRAER